MITLPNNCKCSEPNVFPANWKRAAASVKDPWYISYYFYDADGTRKKVIVKGGVNRYKTAEERRQAMEILLDELLHLLKNQGANPITNKITRPLDQDPSFIEALEYAAGKMKVAASTASDIKSMLTYMQEHTKRLRLAQVPVKEIKRKNIVALINPIESPHKFNKYRSYLSILFEVMVELEITEDNPCLGIKKRKTVKKIKDVMTAEERQKVNEHLKKNYYTFWRFTQIFYHSGYREIESLRIKVKDVDISNQRFKVTVLKGSQPTQMWRTIKTIAVPFWMELLSGANPQHFIFSNNLQPGVNGIRREQITRRWKEHVKNKLGINKDFYSIKYSAATDTAELLGNRAAAQQMGHTNEKMAEKFYNVEHENNVHRTVKSLRNEL